MNTNHCFYWLESGWHICWNASWRIVHCKKKTIGFKQIAGSNNSLRFVADVFFRHVNFRGEWRGNNHPSKKGYFPSQSKALNRFFSFLWSLKSFLKKKHLLKVALNPYPTLPPISPIFMVQWKMGVSPIVDTFQLQNHDYGRKSEST